jgi:hypothetical protein
MISVVGNGIIPIVSAIGRPSPCQAEARDQAEPAAAIPAAMKSATMPVAIIGAMETTYPAAGRHLIGSSSDREQNGSKMNDLAQHDRISLFEGRPKLQARRSNVRLVLELTRLGCKYR